MGFVLAVLVAILGGRYPQIRRYIGSHGIRISYNSSHKSNAKSNTSSGNLSSSSSAESVPVSVSSVPSPNVSASSLLASKSRKVVKINGDKPYFTSSQLTKKPYIKLSKLDSLGRCGTAMMCAYKTGIANTARGDISSVHPSGWNQAFVKKNGKSYALYNRSHLLMWKMSQLNSQSENLITGSEYFNKILMLSVESQVLDYVRSSGDHVMYRVTPIFKGRELVPRGVLMEAKSVETPGLSLCRYVPNIEPDITINYATGAAASALSSVSVSH